ncbi:MAG TPA: hypothetical protein DIV86_07810 [Alphaproteobacteria bacterium]|nr:hypothetical protein [Alphaproteobacteria bacterium]
MVGGITSTHLSYNPPSSTSLMAKNICSKGSERMGIKKTSKAEIITPVKKYIFCNLLNSNIYEPI